VAVVAVVAVVAEAPGRNQHEKPGVRHQVEPMPQSLIILRSYAYQGATSDPDLIR
jgi:hypothetical protein